MTKMNEPMQQKMKQMLENMPRFDYKVIRFFKSKEEMQKAIDLFYNNGMMNLTSRTLTENYINEIYELYIFMPQEGIYTLFTGIFGAVLGGIIGWLHGRSILSLPLLNSASSGGPFVTTILFAGIAGIITATYTALRALYKPIKSVEPGYHMLAIYEDEERKKDIEDILVKFDTIKI